MPHGIAFISFSFGVKAFTHNLFIYMVLVRSLGSFGQGYIIHFRRV